MKTARTRQPPFKGAAKDREASSITPVQPPGVPAHEPPGGALNGIVKHLDLLERCGATLSDAVDSLSRTELAALADRMDLSSLTSIDAARTSVKRRLVNAHGPVRR